MVKTCLIDPLSPSQVAAQRQAEHRAALPGAAAGAEEDHGCGCAAHAGGGEAPLRPPEGGEQSAPSPNFDILCEEDLATVGR